jgi:CBS domain-containing protein
MEAKGAVSGAFRCNLLQRLLGEDVVEAARLMREEHIGSLPITDYEKLVGMITDRDIRLVGIVAQADIALRKNEKKTGQLVEAISEPSAGERR